MSIDNADYAGIDNMLHPDRLPFLKKCVRVKYEGSIDKADANADWDWWLYRDQKNEWVLFDVDGPGCLYNFVQHRYLTSKEPVFRFYFDHEETPRFTIRHCLGDWYPFDRSLRFGIESGGNNNQYLEHSGAVFYYGRDNPGVVQTDEINLGDKVSEKNHQLEFSGRYRRFTLAAQYEGDDDHITLTDSGVKHQGYCSFLATVDPNNAGIRIRRRSDQKSGQQTATVLIDGEPVKESCWYYADRNPVKRWLDDEFLVPKNYKAGKNLIRLTILNQSLGKNNGWNACRYWIDSLINLNRKQHEERSA